MVVRHAHTMRRQSIMLKNSRSRTLSSVMGMPPTLAKSSFVQNVSQRPLDETTTEAMMNLWHVREDRVKEGFRAQILSK